MKLLDVLKKDNLIKETLIANKFINGRGRFKNTKEGMFLKNLLDIIENDYKKGKIKGSWTSTHINENGEIMVKYISRNKKEKIILIDKSVFFISGFIDNLARVIIDFKSNLIVEHNKNNIAATNLLRDFLWYLEFLADRILSNSDINNLFTGKKNWDGTLTELARIAVNETRSGIYRNLGAACKDISNKYSIDGKKINKKSFHSLARQISCNITF